MPPKRRIIVVDTETTGLDWTEHICVEVAWWNIISGERGHFVPSHNTEWVLAHGDPCSLQVNEYRERIMDMPRDDDLTELAAFGQQLGGQTLAGSNPDFDANFLRPLFKRHDMPLWHYRTWDLGSYAASALGLDYVSR